MPRITEQDLEDFGMVKTIGTLATVYPYTKILGMPQIEELPGGVELVVTLERNATEFAIKWPDRSTTWLNIESIEHLQAVEKAIAGWAPSW